MRTAQKNRPSKQISATKSGGSAFGSPGEHSDEIFNQSSLGSWISPPGMEPFPADESPVPHERRSFPRANLRLAMRILRVAGRREAQSLPLQTANISSSGVYARCPFLVEPGTPVHLEVELVHRPAGRGSVRMITEAHVVRVKTDPKTGWHALAFSFDDITFERDYTPFPQFTPR